ncbi:MAG: hypothetical protein GC151_13470 [Betaproteobacteria bacterium]|nr:hypothetical protein [Betaproteobacteria bacterium]
MAESSRNRYDEALERLARASQLPQVKAARAALEDALARFRQAGEEVDAAGNAAGALIGEAFRHRKLLEDQQKSHRFDAPADHLIKKCYGELPTHLVRAFTRDSHVEFSLPHTKRWEKWTPPQTPVGLVEPGTPGFLMRWGSYDPAGKSQLLFTAMPLIGGGRPWLILSDDESDERARDLMRALALRIACMLPQQSRFTFLDPLHYGQTFPLQRYLPAVRETSADPALDLQPIQADVRRIIRDVVAFNPSFDTLPAEQQAAERYEFIFAADFPTAKAYDRRVTDILFDIGRAGPKAGRYVILHMNEGAELPHGVDLSQLGNVWTIDLRKGANTFADVPPEPEIQQSLLERVRGAVPSRRSAAFTDVLPAREAWWTGSSSRRIETSLDGRPDGLDIVFGQRDDGTELVHGILAAASGAGKSNLLHALILGLATRYAPDELHLYLMDLKQGVEFQPYGQLPHAAVVAYNTDPALARAVLAELRREMQRRYEDLFRRANVQKLEDYRDAGQPHGSIPRVLLIVDEYQALFQGADAQEVSADLLALATQGRAAGIHMLLGSQAFRAVGMQASAQILNNINLRMAMQMPAADAQALTELEREAKQLVAKCDAPGKVVLNTAAGRDGSNRLGQVVLVPARDRSEILSGMAELATQWPPERRALWPRTQVFDGSSAPPVAENGLARQAAQAGHPLGADDLARWAAQARSAGGLGRTDWRAGDHPVPLLLGREYAVHGEACSVLRRLPNQNLLVLGGSAAGRLGMLAGIMATVTAIAPEHLASIRVLDLSGDPSVAEVLARAGARASVCQDRTEALSMLDPASATEADLLVLIEPDRVPDLMRPSDPLERSPGVEALEKRLREGPLAGLHTVLVCTGLPALTRVLGRRAANTFAWRAITQVSQEDSQDLLGNRMGSQLRQEGMGGPEPALLADMDGNRFTRFMPYGL